MEAPAPQDRPQAPVVEKDTVKVKKRTLFLALSLVVLVWLLFFWKPWGDAKTVKSPGSSNTTFQRDEPTKPQIFQADYEEKIKDLLNEGKSVAEISNETGVSRKEIRRIKKAMGKGDSDN